MKLAVLLLLNLLTFALKSNADILDVVTISTRLPSRLAFMPSTYDGQDSIYILGGLLTLTDWSSQMLKFSISTGAIEIIPGNKPRGSGVWTDDNSIFYFGGYETHDEIWKMNAQNPDVIGLVNKLPTDAIWTSAVSDGGDNIYVIGGYSFNPTWRSLDSILRYSRSTNTIVNVGKLPTGRLQTSTVWDERTGTGYIFGGHTEIMSGFLNDILKFDSSTGTVTKLDVALPVPIAFTCAVWIEGEAFVIGGSTEEHSLSIVRFNPATNQVINVPVNNFPNKLYAASCVYVEKMKRIYIFGGISQTEQAEFRDQIMYIDLEPATAPPPTTTEASTTTEPVTTTEYTTTTTQTAATEPFTTEYTTTTTQSASTEPTVATTTELPLTTTESETTTTTIPTITTTELPTTTTEQPNTTAVTPNTTTEYPETPINCQGQDGILIPNPFCCESFYQCANGRPVLHHCPSFLQFSPSTQICEYPYIVKCRISYYN